MTGSQRAARYRAKLQERGLRRVQMVVPDFRTPAFQARLQAACAKMAAEPLSAEQQALIAFSDAAWRETPE